MSQVFFDDGFDNTFGEKLHINKLVLCAFDDKRYILDKGTETLAFGHYHIQFG
jgi:hypothetical protein